jgi:hypothetical protein
MNTKKLNRVVVVRHLVNEPKHVGVYAEYYLMNVNYFQQEYEGNHKWIIIAHAGYSLIEKAVFVLELRQNNAKTPLARPALVAKVKSLI